MFLDATREEGEAAVKGPHGDKRLVREVGARSCQP